MEYTKMWKQYTTVIQTVTHSEMIKVVQKIQFFTLLVRKNHKMCIRERLAGTYFLIFQKMLGI